MKNKGLIILLSLLPFIGFAQIAATATLDSISMSIGDQIYITIQTTHDPSITLEGIDISALDTVKSIEILNIKPPSIISSTATQILVEQKIRITSFTADYINLPPIKIPYTKNGKSRHLFTKPLLLKVTSFDVNDGTDLQVIKGIIEEPFTFSDALPYLVLIGGLMLIAFLIWYLIKRSRKEENFGDFAKKKLPAHVIALKKLKNLDTLQLWQTGKIKSFQSQITFILREYLEGRFEIPALESTTDEIVDNLKVSQIEPNIIEKLQTIMQTADLVKFAKSEPPADVHQQAFDNIKAFVNQTIPRAQTETEIDD